MKKLTGFAVINDSMGKRIAFTYSDIREDGVIDKRNEKGSYVVLDDEELSIIESLEKRINKRINSI